MPEGFIIVVFTSKNSFRDFWSAAKECDLEKCPLHGTFSGSYVCAPEQRNLKTRVDLMEKYGHWTCSNNIGEVVQWWASLFEPPSDVLKFVEYLLPRFQDYEFQVFLGSLYERTEK